MITAGRVVKSEMLKKGRKGRGKEEREGGREEGRKGGRDSRSVGGPTRLGSRNYLT